MANKNTWVSLGLFSPEMSGVIWAATHKDHDFGLCLIFGVGFRDDHPRTIQDLEVVNNHGF